MESCQRALLVSVLFLLLSRLVNCDSLNFTNPSPVATHSLLSTTPVSSGKYSAYSSTISTNNTSSVSLGTTTSSTPSPSQSIAPNEIDTILGRRLSYITRGVTALSHIPAWISTLGADGAWPASEVDYTSGCDAQRANWPAQVHWSRLVIMAAAWYGGIPTPDGNTYVHNATVLLAISRGMDYWFKNDFTNPRCIDMGGTSKCPCGTPGFWNTNWYSNVILVPGFVGEVCLLINSTLTTSQYSHCTNILSRTYGEFGQSVNGLGHITGANALDVASISVDLGLLNNNLTVIEDSYRRVHNEVVIQNAVMGDGIRPDGGFSQHSGVLYNGNYGRVYVNDILALEINAGGTRFSAGNNSRDAFSTLLDGDKWMIYKNTLTGTLHWDFSVLGRFISFPVADNQATASVTINATDVQVLGQLWESNVLSDFATDLKDDASTANLADLRGNRMFYNSDYMVHRGPGYVTTVKMFSTRTLNTECLNRQNPLGFHLSDGVVYTYLKGDEYEDIAASWDWNLIPGITVDYGKTPLDCNHTSAVGVETFVGGVSDGQIGLAAMRYTNPLDKSFSWQKAWFFLENDIQVVVLSDLSPSSSSSCSEQIRSVLDQRKRDGEYYVDGFCQDDYTLSEEQKEVVGHNITTIPIANSLWHGDVGYTFDLPLSSPLSLSVQTGNKTGNWSALGISKQPPTTVDLFAAWVNQPSCNPFAYTVYPGTTHHDFQMKKIAQKHMVINNDKHVSAVLDVDTNVALIVFWDAGGGSVLIPSTWGIPSACTLSANANSAVIYRINSGSVTVSDPSQTKASLVIELQAGGRVKSLVFQLPVGGAAGNSVTQVFS